MLTLEAEADLERLFVRTWPFTCRKAGQSPFLRELIIRFGRAGYVALFEIESATRVVVVRCATSSRTTYH